MLVRRVCAALAFCWPASMSREIRSDGAAAVAIGAADLHDASSFAIEMATARSRCVSSQLEYSAAWTRNGTAESWPDECRRLRIRSAVHSARTPSSTPCPSLSAVHPARAALHGDGATDRSVSFHAVLDDYIGGRKAPTPAWLSGDCMGTCSSCAPHHEPPAVAATPAAAEDGQAGGRINHNTH